MQVGRVPQLVPLSLALLVLGGAVGCVKLDQGGGGPSSDGSGGTDGTGGSSGTGGRPHSEIPACAALFDDACEKQPTYDYYLQLCENEDSSAAAAILDCVVPGCKSPLDESTAMCVQLATQDEQSGAVSSLMYQVESLCGSQLDNPDVRVVYIHAASIKVADRLQALTDCLSGVYCNQITKCVTDPDVAPWWYE
jgi:hypothetical protein